jgi:predicted Zn-dependent protease
MNNNQPSTAQSSTTPRADLLLEIEQNPEEYLPELLQFVRLFRQSVTIKRSLNQWENAINEINYSDTVKQQERKTNIKKLFDSWNELDEQEEQQQTLEILESFMKVQCLRSLFLTNHRGAE